MVFFFYCNNDLFNKFSIFLSFFQCLGLLVPAVVETVYRYPDDLGPGQWILIKNGLLCVFALLALVTGAYVSILDIVHIYS